MTLPVADLDAPPIGLGLFTERVGTMFSDLRMDTADIAIALGRSEAAVYRALATWREHRRRQT